MSVPPHGYAQMRAADPASAEPTSAPPSKLESLPAEIVDQILSYLIHPRSRLPGLSEAQSAHGFPKDLRHEIKGREDLTSPPDSARWAANLFSLHALHHPFNALSLVSRRCHGLVESYCSHLVRAFNSTMFNLPLAQLDAFGPQCVWPDLSGIVYRRLWLQHAPRRCIYCYVVLDRYPFPKVKRVVTACGDCFYRQTLTVDEVKAQYHISPDALLASPHIRSYPQSIWVLRIDVEALALQLYGTRAFHSAHKDQLGKPCSMCAITKLKPTGNTRTEPKVKIFRPARKRSRKASS